MLVVVTEITLPATVTIKVYALLYLTKPKFIQGYGKSLMYLDFYLKFLKAKYTYILMEIIFYKTLTCQQKKTQLTSFTLI